MAYFADQPSNFSKPLQSVIDTAYKRRRGFDARAQARKETGLGEDELPEACPWTMDQATDPDFWPE